MYWTKSLDYLIFVDDYTHRKIDTHPSKLLQKKILANFIKCLAELCINWFNCTLQSWLLCLYLVYSNKFDTKDRSWKKPFCWFIEKTMLTHQLYKKLCYSWYLANWSLNTYNILMAIFLDRENSSRFPIIRHSVFF